MTKTNGPVVKESNKSSDSTAITFYPDLSKFDMTEYVQAVFLLLHYE